MTADGALPGGEKDNGGEVRRVVSPQERDVFTTEIPRNDVPKAAIPDGKDKTPTPTMALTRLLLIVLRRGTTVRYDTEGSERFFVSFLFLFFLRHDQNLSEKKGDHDHTHKVCSGMVADPPPTGTLLAAFGVVVAGGGGDGATTVRDVTGVSAAVFAMDKAPTPTPAANNPLDDDDDDDWE